MLKKWFETFYDHKVSLRERMFLLVTSICMVALILILSMGRSLENLLLLVVSFVVILMIVKVSIRKRCINRGGHGDHHIALIALSGEFFYSGRVLQRDA